MEKQEVIAGILGTGACLPSKILDNKDLESIVDTSDEWITKRTGIKERRIADDDKPLYYYGVKAAEKAIENSNLKAEDIDLIIVSTSTPDYLTPSTACKIQNEIGATKAAAFDVNAACTGFIYSLQIAKQFVKASTYNNVLIVSCEGLSRILDWKDRTTCVLFGDGAGAVVVSKVNEGMGLGEILLGSQAELCDNITIPCCYLSDDDKEKRISENYRTLWMDGGEVFKFAARVMSEASKKVITAQGLSMDQIDRIYPHQANIRILDNATKRLNIPKEKVFSNLQKIGNISSASIPVGLNQSVEDGQLKKGDIIVLVAFGGGLTWGSAVLQWN